MNIIGIGPIELLIIALIALVVVGPRGIAELGFKAGRMVRKITHSQLWNEVVNTSRDINEIPRKIMHDVDLEDDFHEIRDLSRKVTGQDQSPTTGSEKHDQQPNKKNND